LRFNALYAIIERKINKTVRNHPVSKQNYGQLFIRDECVPFLFIWQVADEGGVLMNKFRLRYIVEAAIIAAMYAVLTIINPWSSGEIQVRISEALTVLPYFTPAAVPGLFIGCLTANIFVGAGIYDIVFGSLTTFIAAFISYKIKTKLLVPLPPVVLNAVVVAYVLKVTVGAPLLATMGFVAFGQLIACYGLGYPLMIYLDKNRTLIFRR